MRRFKNLMFSSYQAFTNWYSRMAKTFTTLKLEFLRKFKTSQYVTIIISY